MTLAKALGNGIPIGAICAKEHVAQGACPDVSAVLAAAARAPGLIVHMMQHSTAPGGPRQHLCGAAAGVPCG
jgi:acetylornithine/succinyldiaminopimelate/putrescine aminotransferase